MGWQQRWPNILAQDVAPRTGVVPPVCEFVPVTLAGETLASTRAELTLVLTDGLRLRYN
jgi:hypothetical protein